MSREKGDVVQAVFGAWNADRMDAVRVLHHPDATIMTAIAGWPEQAPVVSREATIKYAEALEALGLSE